MCDWALACVCLIHNDSCIPPCDSTCLSYQTSYLFACCATLQVSQVLMVIAFAFLISQIKIFKCNCF